MISPPPKSLEETLRAMGRLVIYVCSYSSIHYAAASMNTRYLLMYAMRASLAEHWLTDRDCVTFRLVSSTPFAVMST